MSTQHNLESIVRRYSEPQIVAIWGHNQDKGLSASEKAQVDAYCQDQALCILCVGCGGGREVFALSRLAYLDVVGTDPSPVLLAEACKYASTHNVSPSFVQGEAAQLPFENESFDVVTMFENVYGHITPHETRLRALAEGRRVLQPGGVILMHVTSLNNRWYYRWAIGALDVVRRLYNPQRMERGDKKMRGERWLTINNSTPVARSHWFRPHEVPYDAGLTGLEVLLSSTVVGVIENPHRSAIRLTSGGRLVYVLRRPAS